jgi:hypothetical protein
MIRKEYYGLAYGSWYVLRHTEKMTRISLWGKTYGEILIVII